MIIPNKKIEIFCGTGGVGKTTIAAARAYALAKSGKKVLLITIDPAKRLKQVLNLDETTEGEVVKVNTSNIDPSDNQTELYAMLMSPGSVLKRIAKENNLEKEFNSNIIQTLSRPYSGMNEIMSIVEVEAQLEKNLYDCIILDTPPGKHFIDFLESSEKIKNFFDKSFLEIFEYLGKNVGDSKKPKGLFNKLVSSGLNKLLSYLEKVTGTEFVQEFIDSVLALYKSRQAFLKALNFQHELKRKEFSNWFLVTSVEQQKMSEANELNKMASKFLHEDNFLVINKCLNDKLTTWNPENTKLQELKSTYVMREKIICDFALNNYKNVVKLDEVNNLKPTIHVLELSNEFINNYMR